MAIVSFNTFVQLTEGRSARVLPKQQPAKKITDAFRPLPALWSNFEENWKRWKVAGWELFNWLFPTRALPADNPPDTPFPALVDQFVDIPTSFSDPLRLSPPQILLLLVAAWVNPGELSSNAAGAGSLSFALPFAYRTQF